MYKTIKTMKRQQDIVDDAGNVVGDFIETHNDTWLVALYDQEKYPSFKKFNTEKEADAYVASLDP